MLVCFHCLSVQYSVLTSVATCSGGPALLLLAGYLCSYVHMTNTHITNGNQTSVLMACCVELGSKCALIPKGLINPFPTQCVVHEVLNLPTPVVRVTPTVW